MAEANKGLELLTNWCKKSGLSCSFFIFSALNIAMVVIGADALNLCTVQPMIPIYLIVAGSTSLILLVVRLLVSHCLIPQINKIDSLNIEGGGQNQDKQPPKQVQITMQLAIKLLRTFDSLASIFSTCWLIVGACYVYSTYEIVTHHVLEDDNYCEYTAYTFAFIVITIGFISLVLSMIAALCACFCKSEDED